MTQLYAHQQRGVERILSQPYLWIGDEMGAGKTLQGIEGACQLYERRDVDQVVALAPAQVFRTIWFDREFGQLGEYARVPSVVTEYRPRQRHWSTAAGGPALRWTVGNYEFVRRRARMLPLLDMVTQKTLLILDESLAVSSPSAHTTKEVYQLRKRCGRVLLLNGTEGGGDTPGDLYAQAAMMSPDILACAGWYEFRARYAKMGGVTQLRKVRLPNGTWKTMRVPVQIVAWLNLEDLWRRLAPYYVRNLKKDCLDLPPKIPYVTIEAQLSTDTWGLYKAMRQDALAYLSGRLAAAGQAGVRALRLSQLCSGFLGGLRALDDEGNPYGAPSTQEVSREKLDALLEWYVPRAAIGQRVMVWTRFRAEAERAAAAFSALGGVHVGLIVGGQGKDERQENVSLLHPKHAPEGPVVVVGTEKAGAFGLNQAAAHAVVHLSSGYSHVVRSQADDRPHRPGLDHPVEYFDVIASGPEGQRTVDHAVVKALRKKESLAAWGMAEWVRALREEVDDGGEVQ